jgi:hypothetical protein
MEFGDTGISDIEVEEILEKVPRIGGDKEHPEIHLDNTSNNRDWGRRKRRKEPKHKEGTSIFPVMTHESLADTLDIPMSDPKPPLGPRHEDVFQFIAEEIIKRRPERFPEVPDSSEEKEIPEWIPLKERERPRDSHNERRRNRTDYLFKEGTTKYKELERHMKGRHPHKLFQ